MHVVQTVGEGEFRRFDQRGVGDAHPVDPAVEVAVPEIEEFREGGEAGGEVEVLPDEALQNVSVIGHPVEDFSGRQAIIVELRNKTTVHRALLDKAPPCE